MRTCPTPLRLEGVLRRLNGVLGSDVRVLRLSPAPEGFDARFSALWRRYAYRVADDPTSSTPCSVLRS